MLLIVTAVTAAAGQAPSDGERRKGLARKLVNTTGGARLGTRLIQATVAQLKETYPTLPDAVWQEHLAEVRTDDIVELVVPRHANYFTAEEMERRQAFYDTPIGRKLLEVQPSILLEAMTVGRQWSEGITRRMLERLKQRGQFGDTPK
jgi:uncharacterized protein